MSRRDGDTTQERNRRARVATLRLRGGNRVTDIARELGVDKRTVHRYVKGVPRRG